MKDHKPIVKSNRSKTWLIILAAIGIIGALALGSLFVFRRVSTAGEFDSLRSIMQYAMTLEEYPSIDNTNWYNPDYTSHYKSQVVGVFNKLFIALGLKQKPAWEIALLDDLVTQVGKDRHKRNLSGACAQAIIPKEHDRYFLWTDIQGAFHSLARCLEFLHDNDVISDDLIIKDDCYFIFNGDVLSYGPYILQTFTLILQLMHKNPDKVLYVRSYHEQPGSWYDSAFAKALKVFNTAHQNEIVPYSPEIDTFLETLPDVLYLLQKEENRYQAVEITFAVDSEDSFAHKCGVITILDHGKRAHSLPYDPEGFIDNTPFNVRALIVEPETPQSMSAHPDGLVPVGMKDFTFKWMALSSPIARSNQVYHFFYDTVIEIATPGSIAEWTISEHRNDVRDATNFVFAGSYYLISGQRPGDAERIANLERQIAQTQQELEAAKQKCVQDQLAHTLEE